MVVVLLWNVNHSLEALQVLLETSKADFIAIQEPPLDSSRSYGAYCPRLGPYYLVHRPGSRAALYISKRHQLREWDIEAGQDWAKVTYYSNKGPITVWSVYNPPLGSQPSTNPLQHPAL